MRPLSVSIIGWWLLVTSIIGVIWSLLMTSDPEIVAALSQSRIPVAAQQVFGVLNGLVIGTCAVGILRGAFWSRPVFVGWSFLSFVMGIGSLGFIISALSTALSVGVVMFFLTRRRARAYFDYA